MRYLIVLMGLLAFAPVADAKLKLVEQPIRWLNTNRERLSGAYLVQNDTTHIGISLTRPDTSMIVEAAKVVPFPYWSSQAADSTGRTIARVVLVSDSTVAPTADSINVELHGLVWNDVGGTLGDNPLLSEAAGFSISKRLFAQTTPGRIMVLPITYHPGSDVSGKNNPLGWQYWRLIVSAGWLSTSKHAGRLRGVIQYYVEE